MSSRERLWQRYHIAFCDEFIGLRTVRPSPLVGDRSLDETPKKKKKKDSRDAPTSQRLSVRASIYRRFLSNLLDDRIGWASISV